MTPAARNELRYFDGWLTKRMMDFCRGEKALPHIVFDLFFRSAIRAFESEFGGEYPDQAVDAADLLEYFTSLFRRKLESGKSRISDERDIAAVDRLQNQLEDYCACGLELKHDGAWVIGAYWGCV